MKGFVFSLWVCCCLLCAKGESLSRYWLIEEDFIKLGKKELYEEEKKKRLQGDRDFFNKKRKPFEVIGAQDLENPQYVFLMPLKDLSYLDLYPPIRGEGSSLLNTCVHFRIFSLHELLEDGSFRGGSSFSESRPYLSYIIYDVFPGSEQSFEQHFVEVVLKQPKKSSFAWNSWRTLLGADGPKYLICASFPSKEELKETKLEDLFEEIAIKEIIRNKKSGWMKSQESLSISKK